MEKDKRRKVNKLRKEFNVDLYIASKSYNKFPNDFDEMKNYALIKQKELENKEILKSENDKKIFFEKVLNPDEPELKLRKAFEEYVKNIKD